MSSIPSSKSLADDHTYRAACSQDSRSPCPALNTLANHGFLTRSGKNITVTELIHAIQTVYNISLPLACILVGPVPFMYSKWTFNDSPLIPWRWSLSLDLADLAEHGHYKVAHLASLVHPNCPSHAPDQDMLHEVLSRARFEHSSASTSTQTSIEGLGVSELASIRLDREMLLAKPLSTFHNRIAMGECALAFLMLSEHSSTESVDRRMIPVSRFEQWFGQERLPEGWWEGQRPPRTIGLDDVHNIISHLEDAMRDTQMSR